MEPSISEAQEEVNKYLKRIRKYVTANNKASEELRKDPEFQENASTKARLEAARPSHPFRYIIVRERGSQGTKRIHYHMLSILPRTTT